ncbi:MAG: DUF1592 domain-containing protein [Verrucomicrobiales bacterium]
MNCFRSTYPVSKAARVLALAAPLVLSAAEEPDVRGQLEPLLSESCYDCHDDIESKSDLNLLDLEFEPGNPANFKIWERVFKRVESGEMPPEKKPRPDPDLKSAFLEHLESPLLAEDRAKKAAEGRVKVRRLTRREYEHTLHDLLGIDIPLQTVLPVEQETHGFETVASGQQFSHFNLARYLEAADLALDEAFQRATGEEETFSRTYPAFKLGKGGGGRGNYRGPQTKDKLSIAWPIRLPFYGRMPATSVPESGRYRITLKGVHSINAAAGAAWGTLSSGACVSNDPLLHGIGLVEATPEKRDLTYEAWIEKGDMLEMKPADATRKSAPTGAKGGNVGYEGRDLVEDDFEGIALKEIRIERIYPNGTVQEVRRNLFGDLSPEKVTKLSNPKADSEELLRKTIRQFADRAFRRPATDKQIAPYLDLALAETKGKRKPPMTGLRAAYQAILCSPRFLTFIEKPGRLDDHALASRLSYMIWNSMPDRELRHLADQGKLSERKVSRTQLDRLLDDPKAERFIASFTDQWLNLAEINFTVPDRRLYKSFDPTVQESMLMETRAFVGHLVASDGDIRHFVKSDFGMLNERLARFYGLDNVALKPGSGLQKVSLEEGRRSGLITQGSVLKVTADGTTTSPIVRGVWVGERILGLEIPPPPPGVPAVEPDIRGAVSIRDQIEKHRNSENCAACHAKIDPPGFALETFDPVGLPRAKYGSSKQAAAVDPSGVTPEGETFANIDEWKNIYLQKPDQLAEGFAKQLLTYATGATPTFSDRPALANIVEQAREKGYGTKSMIHLAVASEIFRTK